MNYIYSEKLSALDNMLVDSYLTTRCTDEYFRLYKWAKPTLSLGAANKMNEINLKYIRKNNIDVVYRETGGGIVFHNDDLCFSFITNAKISVLKPKENYYIVKEIIEKILQNLGQLITKTNDINIKSPICFNGSNNHEISIDNKKVVGIAQKFVKNRYLIQGSIQLKTMTIEHLISDNHKKIVQYGLNNIEFNTLKDKIYRSFNKKFNLVEIEDNDILNQKECLEFKKENKGKFTMAVLSEIYVPKEIVNDKFVKIAKLYVKSGDAIKKDDVLVDLETSKTIVSIPAETDGFIDLFCKEGENLEIDSLLMNIVDF